MRTMDEGSAASTAAAQGQLWSARAGDWAQLHEHLHTPLYEAAFEAMGIGPQTRLLDAGCGSGVAASLAAARGAQVVGLDAAPAMIAIATTRLSGADFRVGELENLPFPDDSFTAASAFNSASYAADPTRALAELGRVLTPGGPVATATWGQPDACQMRQVFAALAPFLPPPPPGAEGGPFALLAPGRLEQLVAAAGLTPGTATEVACHFDYPDAETAWRALSAAGPFVAAIRAGGEPAVRAAVQQALGPFQTATGGVRLENSFRYLLGRAEHHQARSTARSEAPIREA